MNRHRTIAAVTAAFGQIIDEAATSAVASAVVNYARPDTAGIEPKVYIYMYQVTPNAAARNLEMPVRDSGGVGKQRPFVALDLHYLITFVGDEKKLQPQEMLGSVVGAVHARPLLSPEEIRNAQVSATDPPLIGDDDEVPVVQVRFTPLGLSLEELSKVWSVFFQTPYSLSVVYRASVVLVEADIPIRPSLPAQGTRGTAGPIANPVVAQVMAAAGVYQPITIDSTLVITGKRLRGEQTLVRFAGGDVAPAQINENRITLPVPAVAQVVGLQSVRIVHRPWDAAPGDASNEIESNLASFALHPRVTGVTLAGTTLSVDVTPAVAQAQRADVLLDQLGVDVPAFHQFRRLAFVGESATTLQFDITGVAVGTYGVRVRVDGAASLMEIDQNTGTAIHTVEVL